MTQGIFVYGSRPPTKKYLATQVDLINSNNADPYSVVIEATSMFGNEFDGSLAKAVNCMDLTCSDFDDEVPHNHTGPFYLVGPDPRTSRKWYASLEYDPEKERWILK